MSNALREQLLKSGLVSKDQAQQVEKQTKLQSHQQAKAQQRDKKRNVAPSVDPQSVAYQVAKAREEEIARAKELNRQRELERQHKELQAQSRQLIDTFHVNDSDAEIIYHFMDGKTVKHLSVTSKQRTQLGNGQLGIAKWEDHYYLIPASIIEKLLERTPETVVCFYPNKEAKQTDEDPYAAYQVPDDLMW